MRSFSALIVLAVALAGLSLLTCDALKLIDVTLDITGSPLAVFTGYYKTTTTGQSQIQGSPPKSYTFSARKGVDTVQVQLVCVGTGELKAKLTADGVARDSGTISTVGALTLTWIPQ